MRILLYEKAGPGLPCVPGSREESVRRRVLRRERRGHHSFEARSGKEPRALKGDAWPGREISRPSGRLDFFKISPQPAQNSWLVIYAWHAEIYRGLAVNARNGRKHTSILEKKL